VVSWDNYGDAESFLRVVKAEVARDMTNRAINCEFQDPDKVQSDMRMRKWKSFEWGAKIIGTPLENNNGNKNTNLNKRTRKNNPNNNQYQLKQGTVIEISNTSN
jgi:hypothetical protein